MPRQSDDTGHLCPRPGCGGFCWIDDTTHSKFTPRTDRKRVCYKCGANGPTREINGPDWEFPDFTPKPEPIVEPIRDLFSSLSRIDTD